MLYGHRSTLGIAESVYTNMLCASHHRQSVVGSRGPGRGVARSFTLSACQLPPHYRQCVLPFSLPTHAAAAFVFSRARTVSRIFCWSVSAVAPRDFSFQSVDTPTARYLQLLVFHNNRSIDSRFTLNIIFLFLIVYPPSVDDAMLCAHSTAGLRSTSR